MFGQSIYDPSAKWRTEPATAAQLRTIIEDGGVPTTGMTKGAAADVIGRLCEPAPEEIGFLKFFGVKLPAGATQYDARKHIATIIASPSNKEKWEARPATKEQRALIRSVQGKVPSGLTAVAAEKLIATFDDDGEMQAKLEAAHDAVYIAEDRRDSIKDYADTLREDGDIYGVKHVGLRLITQAIEAWERESGRTLAQLESDPDFLDKLAERIRMMDPSKATKDAVKFPAIHGATGTSAASGAWPASMRRAQAAPPRPADSGGSVWLSIAAVCVLATLLASCLR